MWKVSKSIFVTAVAHCYLIIFGRGTRYIIPELVMEVLGLGNLTKVNNNVLP